jgi:AraC-like DNA-binding protein
MDKLPLIDASEWIDSSYDEVPISYTYRNVVTVASVNANVFSHRNACFLTEQHPDGYSTPVRINRLFVILVLKGTVRLSLDYTSYSVSANHLLLIMPTHIIRVAGTDEDFEAKVLMLNKEFLEDCLVNKCTPSLMLDYIQLCRAPCTSLVEEETACMERCFLQLEEKIKLRVHAFHAEVMQNSVLALLLELANVLVAKKELSNRPTFSRKEEIMNRFLELLLQCGGRERMVTFYADKLCVTPQYLTSVLKKLTGKPANKWIEEALIIEAKIQLKAPHITVQQVAAALRFPDQAAFSKYFKKHTGLSPLAYRRL